jgi:hypothetical protein
MLLQTFIDKGGFKLLAVARLSGAAYATVCYLCNCLAAGVEEIVTSTGELSLLLGVGERATRVALEELESSRIVFITGQGQGKTLALRLNVDPTSWDNLRKDPAPSKRRRSPLGDAKNIHSLLPQSPLPEGQNGRLRDVSDPSPGEKADGPTPTSENSGSIAMALGASGLSSREALIFPVGKQGQKSTEKHHNPDLEATAIKRVLEVFGKYKDTFDIEKETSYAALLSENHPVEQIVEILQAFGKEIPSLGLLAGAWLHYSERLHHLEKEEISLDAYRKKHETMEKKLRQLAHAELKRAQGLKVTLSADEELLLRIFTRHDQPRKQLYWALQAAARYPHLQEFFHATAHMALRHHKGK